MKRVKLAILGSLIALAACSAGCSKISNGGPMPWNILRTIASAQELYKSRNGHYGDYFDLCNSNYIKPSLARNDPDHPRHSDRQGYYYDISVNEDNSDWCCIAAPAEWREGFARNWKINREGVICYNETEGDLTNFTKVFKGE